MRAPMLLSMVAASWLCNACTAQAQTTLRYKFKEGESLKYVFDMKMKMSMSILGKEIDMNMNQTSDMVWAIQSVDDKGNAKIKVTFGRNKLSMDMPTGKVEIDSDAAGQPDDPVGQVLYKVIKSMAGLEISASMSAAGELSDLKIPEKQLAQFQNIPGGEAFGDIFSPEGLKRTLSQSGLVMPKEAVSKGANWKNKNDMKLPIGKMTAEIEYTYGGSIDKDGRTLEKIELKPRATLEPDPKSPIAMKLKTQDGKGVALFDNSQGRLLEVTTQQTMEMEAEINGMTFNQKMVQTMTMKLADKK